MQQESWFTGGLASHHFDTKSNMTAVSPDGMFIARASLSGDATIDIWPTDKFATRAAPSTSHADAHEHITCMALAADSLSLYAGIGSSVYRYSTADALYMGRFARPNSSSIACIAASADGKRLASGETGSNEICVWSTRNYSLTQIVKDAERAAVTALAFSWDSLFLASGHANGMSKVWVVHDIVGSSGDDVQAVRNTKHKQSVVAISFVPRTKRSVMLVQLADALRFVELDSLAEPVTYRFKKSIAVCAFSPDGRRFALALRGEAAVQINDTAAALAKKGTTALKPVISFHVPILDRVPKITSVCFLDSNRVIVAAAQDAILWTVAQQTQQAVPFLPLDYESRVQQFGLSRDGTWIVHANHKQDAFELIHRTPTYIRNKFQFEGCCPIFHSSANRLFFFREAGNSIQCLDLDIAAQASIDHSAAEIPVELPTAALSTTPGVLLAGVFLMSFSPDGRYLLCLSKRNGKRLATIWHVTSEHDTLTLHYRLETSARLSSASIAADNKCVLMATTLPEFRIWRLLPVTSAEAAVSSWKELIKVNGDFRSGCLFQSHTRFGAALGTASGHIHLFSKYNSDFFDNGNPSTPDMTIRHSIQSIDDISAAPDGQHLLARISNEILLIDAQSGALQVFCGRRAAMTQDGRTLALADAFHAVILTSSVVSKAIYGLLALLRIGFASEFEVLSILRTFRLSPNAVFRSKRTTYDRELVLDLPLAALLFGCSTANFRKLMQSDGFADMVVHHFPENGPKHRNALTYAASKHLTAELDSLVDRLAGRMCGGDNACGAYTARCTDAQLVDETHLQSDSFAYIARRVPAAATGMLGKLELTIDSQDRGLDHTVVFTHDQIDGANGADDFKEEVPIRHRVSLFPEITNRAYWAAAKEGDSRKGILETLTDCNIVDAFDMPVVQAMLTYRWQQVRAMFYVQLLLYLVYLGLASAFSIHIVAKDKLSLSLSDVYALPDNSSYAGVGIAVLALNTWFLYIELLQASSSGLRVYFRDAWNVVDLGAYSLVISACVLHCLRMQEEFAVTTVAILLIWLKILEHCRGFEGSGLFVVLMLRIAWEIRYFVLVWVIILLGFSNAYVVMFRANDAAGQYWNLATGFVTIFGGNSGPNLRGNAFEPQETQLYNLQLVTNVAIVAIGNLLLLNMLIAMMNAVYSTVTAQAGRHYRLQKAGLIIELERTFLPLVHFQDRFRFLAAAWLNCKVACAFVARLILLPLWLLFFAVAITIFGRVYGYQQMIGFALYVRGQLNDGIDNVILKPSRTPFRLRDSRWLHYQAPLTSDLWGSADAGPGVVPPPPPPPPASPMAHYAALPRAARFSYENPHARQLSPTLPRAEARQSPDLVRRSEQDSPSPIASRPNQPRDGAHDGHL